MSALAERAADGPVLCPGPNQLAGYLSAATQGSRVMLLIDADASVRDWYPAVRYAAAPASLMPLAAQPTVAALRAVLDRLRAADCETIVAVGGGAILDLARLAAAVRAHADPAVVMATLTRGRAGLIAFPSRRDRVRVIAVPTTLGTGAEFSATACLIVDGHRRLVAGEGLRACSAVHYPAVYATLPRESVGEAILEIIMRVVGPFVGSAPDDSIDRRAVRLLIGLRDQALRWHRGEALDLAELAADSAVTHTPALQAGRAPFSPKLWYVANELAAVAGVRKMAAQRVLLATYLRRISAGDVRWGSRERLRVLGQRVVGRGDPAAAQGQWLNALARVLVRTPPVSASQELAGAAGQRAFRAWAAGQPMLGGLSAHDLVSFVAEALG